MAAGTRADTQRTLLLAHLSDFSSSVGVERAGLPPQDHSSKQMGPPGLMPAMRLVTGADHFDLRGAAGFVFQPILAALFRCGNAAG